MTKKIFVVDDDRFHLELMEQMLQSFNQEDITLFEKSKDCLVALKQNPEIIFLDHNMDDYNGFEVLKKIKRVNPNIFVVMISSQEEIRTAVNALKFGAFDYLEKNDQLMQNIGQTLQRIEEVKEILTNNKPSLMKKIFKYL
jgi:DNA-binding NtrC family response regulator